MASTTTADYQVLSGVSTALDASTPHREVEFDFTVSGLGMVISNDFRRPVLSFLVRVHKQASLKIFVNSQSVLDWNLGVDTKLKGVWHPWAAGGVLVQFPGTVKVRFLVSPSGKVDISNVVMWYQVHKDG